MTSGRCTADFGWCSRTTLRLVRADGFELEVIDEDPETFHQRAFDVGRRALWVPRLDTRRVLVLGSSQREDTLNHRVLDRTGISVTRRRTGGGAVLVSAGDLVWFDIVITPTDVLWVDDVGRSFNWLGAAVQDALSSLGVDTRRHEGSLIKTEWSDRVCFAGVGPGELLIDDHKLVGMSQRRTKSAARFQVAILRSWDGAEHRSFFDVPDNESAEADRTLQSVARGIPHPPGEIMAAVVASLAHH